MNQQLRDRLEKYPNEVELSGDTAPDLLNIAIWVIEAVKTDKICSGHYASAQLASMDTTSSILRNSR